MQRCQCNSLRFSRQTNASFVLAKLFRCPLFNFVYFGKMAHMLNSQQTRPQPPPPLAAVNLHDAQQNAVGVVKGIKKQNTKETLSTGAAFVKGPDPVSISIWAASAGLGYVCNSIFVHIVIILFLLL